jgi:hypothetical protein
VPAPALRTAATGLVREDDVIPGGNALYTLASLDDHARPFMSEYSRHLRVVPFINNIDIGTANASGNDTDQDLVVARAFHLKRFYLQRSAFLTEDRCLDLLRK